ncbi:MAG: hypothetical protein MZV70_48450 [Desulfobacterales bacterium]|nr:hypothetical protein [Desulfobacterales bacterium]
MTDALTPEFPAGRLPVEAVLAELAAALRAGPAAVLLAPPGAGKTTRVPPGPAGRALAGGPASIVDAASRGAWRRAQPPCAWRSCAGEPVGRTVGYRVRLDTRVGPETRIEVVTEGVLTRMLQRDPALSGRRAGDLRRVPRAAPRVRPRAGAVPGPAGRAEPRAAAAGDVRDPRGRAPVAELLGGAPVDRAARAGSTRSRRATSAGRPRSGLEAAVAAGGARRPPARGRAASSLSCPGRRRSAGCCALLAPHALRGPEWMLAPLFGNLVQGGAGPGDRARRRPAGARSCWPPTSPRPA